MKKPSRTRPLTLYDVAAGPMYLALFGIPVAIVAGVCLIVYLAGKLIRRARDKDQNQ